MALTTVDSSSTPAGLAAPAGLRGGDRFADLFLEPQGGGENEGLGHHRGGQGFDVDGLDISLGEDVEAAGQFLFRVNLVFGEKVDGVLAGDNGEDIDGVLEVGQTALGGFGVPFLGVIVAVVENPLVLLDDRREEVPERPC